MAKFSERDFADGLAELSGKLRRDIEAHSLGIDPSPSAIAARRKRVLSGDFKFFAYTYFPHHIRGESSQFQAFFCNRFPQVLVIPGGAMDWFVAPRGECKSSLLTKIGPLWSVVQHLLQKPDIRLEVGQSSAPVLIDYIVLLGAERKLPAKLIEVVKAELLMNSALAMDFPEVCGKSWLWRIGEIVTVNGVKIECFGAEQAVRGTFHNGSRPQLILGDDLMTDTEAKSPTERENRWKWLENAIDYLGPPDGSVKYMGVGTILNKDDPISRAKKTIGHLVHHFKALVKFPKNMDLWERCEEVMRNDDARFEKLLAESGDVANHEDLPSYRFYLRNKTKMDKGAEVSWPSVRPLFNLMRARAKSRKAFATEMQGDARTDEDTTFSNIQFWVQKLSHWVYFGACDPSMGKGESADPSALLVGAIDRNSMILHVVEAEIKRRTPSKLESDLISLQTEYKCLAWGFENNNAYEYMRSSFMKEALRRHVQLPLVGVTATVPQEVRIESIEPFISQNPAMILFWAGLTQLLDELDTFPEKQSGHHYDGLTALHILHAIAVSRAGGIPKIKSRSSNVRSRFRGY